VRKAKSRRYIKTNQNGRSFIGGKMTSLCHQGGATNRSLISYEGSRKLQARYRRAMESDEITGIYKAASLSQRRDFYKLPL
jgi:hypothetical protein